MKRFLAATALASMLASGAAMAGEWDGAYGGVYGTALDTSTGAGVQLGYNFGQGNLVFGGEVDLSVYSAGTLGEIHGRIGAKVTPNLLAYGLVGVGKQLSFIASYAVLGAGAEYQFSPGWGLRADYEYLQVFGGGATASNFRLGVVRNF